MQRTAPAAQAAGVAREEGREHRYEGRLALLLECRVDGRPDARLLRFGGCQRTRECRRVSKRSPALEKLKAISSPRVQGMARSP
jgi:hypothetical protein